MHLVYFCFRFYVSKCIEQTAYTGKITEVQMEIPETVPDTEIKYTQVKKNVLHSVLHPLFCKIVNNANCMTVWTDSTHSYHKIKWIARIFAF